MPGRHDTQFSAATAIADGKTLNGPGMGEAGAVMTVQAAGGVSAGTVLFQGSADGTNWDTIGSDALTTDGTTRTLLTEPYRYLRARISVAIVGGTATVYITIPGKSPDEWEDTP